MKVVPIKDAKAKLSGYCDDAQHERVLITRHGKPVALVIGVEGQDLEHVMTASNPDFWRLIEERRRQPTLSSEEMRERLSGPKKRRRRSKKR